MLMKPAPSSRQYENKTLMFASTIARSPHRLVSPVASRFLSLCFDDACDISRLRRGHGHGRIFWSGHQQIVVRQREFHTRAVTPDPSANAGTSNRQVASEPRRGATITAMSSFLTLYRTRRRHHFRRCMYQKSRSGASIPDS